MKSKTSEASFGLSGLVLSGFLRIVSHPRVFDIPTPVDEGLKFTEALRNQPNCISVHPGPRHFEIFSNLCRKAQVKGNLVSDAYIAALAIESGSELVTTDRDYARFPDLRWSHPLEVGREGPAPLPDN